MDFADRIRSSSRISIAAFRTMKAMGWSGCFHEAEDNCSHTPQTIANDHRVFDAWSKTPEEGAT